MARARNIKPAFFTNDELAEIDPLGRLLFIGLWTIADFKGELEWREKRIKAQILPYDDCDVKRIALNLDKSGFIRFYSDNEKMYLNVCNFAKHQNPHKNERIKGSHIPKYTDKMRQVVDLSTITINHDKSGLNHDENETNRADSLSLIPDPLSPNPESLLKEKPLPTKLNFAEEDLNFANWFYEKLLELNPKHKKPRSFDKWANTIRLIRISDKKTYDEMSNLFLWVCRDDFWKGNILSPDKFRKQWDMLTIQMDKAPSPRRDINAIGKDFSAPERWT